MTRNLAIARRDTTFAILRLAMKVIFLRTLRNPLRSLRLRIFTAKDAKIYAKDAKKNGTRSRNFFELLFPDDLQKIIMRP